MYKRQTLAGSTTTLEFADEKLSGSTGCNFFGAGYTLEGDVISVAIMEVTLQYCSDGLMAQEGAYLTALGAAQSLALEGERLAIIHPEGELIFKPATDMPLEGSTWVLNGIAHSGAIVETWIDAEITAEFVDGKMVGSSGCNHYSVAYALEGESLSLSMAIGTLIACDEERMAREAEFLGALEKVASHQIKMDSLTLSDAEGNPVIHFRLATDLPLEGTDWTLQGIVESGGMVSSWVDAEITAEFAAGQVTGSAGCNQYFSGYELDGASLSMGPVGRTEMACMGEGRMEREDAFLKALEAVKSYSIKMDALTLTDAAGETLIIFKAGEAAPQ